MGSSILKFFFVVILHLAIVPSTGDDDEKYLTAYSNPELVHDEFCPVGTPTKRTALVTKGIWALGAEHVRCGSRMMVYCLGKGCIINPETEESSVLVIIVGSVTTDSASLFILSEDAFITITAPGSYLMRTDCRLFSEVKLSVGLPGDVTMTPVSGGQVTVSEEDGQVTTVDYPTISEEEVTTVDDSTISEQVIAESEEVTTVES